MTDSPIFKGIHALTSLSFRVCSGHVAYFSETNDDGLREPFIYLEVEPSDSKLKRILGGRSASATLLSHATGVDLTGAGVPTHGTIQIHAPSSSAGAEEPHLVASTDAYVQIAALLPKDQFVAATNALLIGGRTLSDRCSLSIFLQERQDRDEFFGSDTPPCQATYLLSSVALVCRF